MPAIETPEYQAGRQAWEENRPAGHNPHITNSCEREDWEAGWEDTKEEKKKKDVRIAKELAGNAGYRDYDNGEDDLEEGAAKAWLSLQERPRLMPHWWLQHYRRGWEEARKDAEPIFG